MFTQNWHIVLLLSCFNVLLSGIEVICMACCVCFGRDDLDSVVDLRPSRLGRDEREDLFPHLFLPIFWLLLL